MNNKEIGIKTLVIETSKELAKELKKDVKFRQEITFNIWAFAYKTIIEELSAHMDANVGLSVIGNEFATSKGEVFYDYMREFGIVFVDFKKNFDKEVESEFVDGLLYGDFFENYVQEEPKFIKRKKRK